MREITNRPWGSYEVLLDEPTYKVKRIVLKPEQSLSLQYHNNRFEDWVIVQGDGIVSVGDLSSRCVVGDSFHIPPTKIHRAIAGKLGLTFIEVQRGICDEDDIVRLEDNYGRT